MNKFLDKFPNDLTIFLGIAFFLMPFLPEPHLVAKVLMIRDGAALGLVDVVDMAMHAAAGVFVALKVLRMRKLKVLGRVAEGDRDALPKD